MASIIIIIIIIIILSSFSYHFTDVTKFWTKRILLFTQSILARISEQ